MTELVNFQDLVARVTSGTDEPLARLELAEETAEDLHRYGDRLVGYFVEEARAAGLSWTDIGRHLGVSRQAAQQRYTPRLSTLTLPDLGQTATFQRMTDRARAVLERASMAARTHRHDQVRTEHIVWGMLDDADSLAVKVLVELGAAPDAVRATLSRRVEDGTGEPAAVPPFAPQARRVLDESLAEALELGHNYLGTEHFLLGLLRRPDGAGGAALTELGITLEAARASTKEHLNELLRRLGRA